MTMKRLEDIPMSIVSDDAKVNAAAEAALRVVLSCALVDKKISRNAVESEMRRKAPTLFARIRQHPSFRAAMSWCV